MFNDKEISLSNWIKYKGSEDDIILSSRIRLARNLKRLPFPGQSTRKQLDEVVNIIKDILLDKEIEIAGDKYKFNYIEIENLSPVKRMMFVEKNLSSPHFIKNDGYGKILFYDQDEKISIMVNEEDHLRIQILLPGLQINKAWEMADQLDDILERETEYAFSKDWGYLSACPTNVGTGLRSSVMVHLPGLDLNNNINRLFEVVSKLGLTVRGIYGEGSESAGNIYQISNQITLGSREEDIIENLESVTRQVINQEKNARDKLFNEREIFIKDKILRAYGKLKYAYSITTSEAMELLSYVKLGMEMGLIDEIDSLLLKKLFIIIRPAHLQAMIGEKIESTQRDLKRAELIQTELNGKGGKI
ncbi:MAG TPA: protein arginine kinase [Halanaerobiales bacterium]|nr:protein arginine kinase [Halanaerobiales bacterium]